MLTEWSFFFFVCELNSSSCACHTAAPGMFKQVIKAFFPSADDKPITLLLEDYLLYKQTLVLLFLCLSSARDQERVAGKTLKDR